MEKFTLKFGAIIIVIVFGLNINVFAQTMLPEPQSFYDFENASGTVVTDLGVLENDGLLVGDSIEWATGGITSSQEEGQGCIKISGSVYEVAGYFEIPYNAIHNSEDYTVATWVKWDVNTNPAWSILFGQGYATDGVSRINLSFDPSESVHTTYSRVYDQAGARTQVSDSENRTGTSLDIFNGDWHLLAVTLEEGKNIGIWTDGKLLKSGTSNAVLASIADTIPLMIGAGFSDSQDLDEIQKVIGLIDRVRIYDTALDSAQMSNLYKYDIEGWPTTAINETASSAMFALKQNSPNPFNSNTRIGYMLEDSGNVSLQIFDISGKIVATLENEYKQAGSYESIWISDLENGIYFYQLTVSSSNGVFSDIKKMIIAK